MKKIHKRIIAVLLSSLIWVSVASFPVSATQSHSVCRFNGVYTSTIQPSNMKFLIMESARVSPYLTTSTYSVATEWNNISSNVHVSVYYHGGGMPTTGFVPVEGKSLYTSSNHILGYTECYDTNGNPTSENSNWLYVKILMDTGNHFNGISAAKKTFKHEVGHALILAHPFAFSPLQYHTHGTYNNLPVSVMNQGSPNSDEISVNIEAHDKLLLKDKWGV